jgi:hypothetical protein
MGNGLGQRLLCFALRPTLLVLRPLNSNLLSPRCRGSIVAAIEPLERRSRSHLDCSAWPAPPRLGLESPWLLTVWVLLEVPLLALPRL